MVFLAGVLVFFPAALVVAFFFLAAGLPTRLVELFVWVVFLDLVVFLALADAVVLAFVLVAAFLVGLAFAGDLVIGGSEDDGNFAESVHSLIFTHDFDGATINVSYNEVHVIGIPGDFNSGIAILNGLGAVNGSTVMPEAPSTIWVHSNQIDIQEGDPEEAVAAGVCRISSACNKQSKRGASPSLYVRRISALIDSINKAK